MCIAAKNEQGAFLPQSTPAWFKSFFMLFLLTQKTVGINYNYPNYEVLNDKEKINNNNRTYIEHWTTALQFKLFPNFQRPSLHSSKRIY